MKVVINDERVEPHEWVVPPPVTVIRYGVTEEEFFRVADEDSHLELFDGELIMNSPASRQHEDLFMFLAPLLRSFADRRGLGVVLGSRFPLHLGAGRLFEPDLLYLSKANLHRLGEKQAEAPADLVVEILSPSTRRFDLGSKRQAYRDVKTPEAWFIDADNKVVLVDRSSPAGYVEQKFTDGRIDSRAMPDFWIEAGWIWSRPLPDPLTCLLKILGPGSV